MADWFYYALAKKFPMFDPSWPDSVQDKWWLCFQQLWDRKPGAKIVIPESYRRKHG